MNNVTDSIYTSLTYERLIEQGGECCLKAASKGFHLNLVL